MSIQYNKIEKESKKAILYTKETFELSGPSPD